MVQQRYNAHMLAISKPLTIIVVSFGVAGAASAQAPPRYEPVEQYIADMNPLSISLRRLHIGIARPTGFQDVFHVPGEPGKLMRVHGSVQAVFSQSLYGFNEDEEIEAVIPPNTVFRIGPRAVNGSRAVSLIDGHPGLVAGHREETTGSEPNPYRVLAEGFGRDAVRPRPRLRTLSASRESSFSLAARSNEEQQDDERELFDAPGTIIGDEQYRRERLHALMRRAAEGE